jgi:hypothetical protein
MKVVVSRSLLTTIVMWSYRMMLATMQAELVPRGNTPRHNTTRIRVQALAPQRT